MHIGKLLNRIIVSFKALSVPNCWLSRFWEERELIVRCELCVNYEFKWVLNISNLLNLNLNLSLFGGCYWFLRNTWKGFYGHLIFAFYLFSGDVNDNNFHLSENIVVIRRCDILNVQNKTVKFEGSEWTELACLWNSLNVDFVINKDLISKGD